MRLALTTRHLVTNRALKDLAERRAGYALARFGGHLREVRLRLVGDGAQVACVATARVMPRELLAVHGVYATAENAICDACERLRERIVRSLERRRERLRA